MLGAGPISNNGRKLNRSSSEESQWLFQVLNAINNQTSAIVAALGGVTGYNDSQQYDLLSSIVQSFPANTIHSISFSVIKGSVLVALGDGGSVTYPVGSNVNLQATNTFDAPITMTVSGALNDGNNRVIVQTTFA